MDALGACLRYQRPDEGHALLFIHLSLALGLAAVPLAVPAEPCVLPALRQLAPGRHPLLIATENLWTSE